jgi:tape measure domain-containing protein
MATEEVKFVFSMDDQFSKQAKQAESVAGKLQTTLGNIKTAIAGAFTVGAVVSFGRAVIDSLKNYEYFHASLGALLKGNREAANALESQLIALAKTTPFELTEVQTATKQLISYGIKAGDVVETMKTLGDVSAGVGAPLQDIAYLYGTLKTQGRAMMIDIRQFAGRGIPIYEALAKVLKVNTNQINDLVSAGKVGFKDVEKAFQSMTREGGQFYNLMEAQNKTVGGRLSNLADVWEQIKVDIGKSQSGILANTVKWASDMAGALEGNLAGSNRRNEAYKKYGGEDFNFMQRGGSSIADLLGAAGINIKSKVNETEQFEEGLQNMFVKNSKTKLDALRSEVQLRNLLANQYKAFKEGDIDKAELDRKQAIIRATIDQVKGLRDISTMKANPTTKEGAGAIAAEADKVKSQKYTNITINIDKVTGIEKVENKTENQLGEITGDAITRYLIKGITDAQIAAE